MSISNQVHTFDIKFILFLFFMGKKQMEYHLLLSQALQSY